VLFGPLGGAYADRLPKRRVIAIGQTLSALSLGSLGWLYADGSIRLVHLVSSSFVLGSAFGFIGPARQALVVDLVPVALRGNAMTLSNVANTMSRVLGPFVAGVLLATGSLGAAAAYATMGACYLGSAAILLALPKSVVREGAGAAHVIADLGEGLRYAWTQVHLRHLLIFFVGVMLIGFPHVTLVPGLLENELGRPAEDVTQIALCSAIGAFLMSVNLARFADGPHATRIYSWMAVGFGLTLCLLAWVPDFASALAAIVLVGASSGGFHALNGAVIARETEEMYMGRVMSLTMMAFAGFSLTALPLGIAADLVGERPVLFGMGLGVLALSSIMIVRVARDARAERPGKPVQPAHGMPPGG
jgi:MFS family permease